MNIRDFILQVLHGFAVPFDFRNLSMVIRNCIWLLVILSIVLVLQLAALNNCGSAVIWMTFVTTAIGCFAFGGAIGFLFGLPKMQKDYKDDSKFVDNTALEEVSDWFTKIIVGLTLVELKSILKLIGGAADRIAQSLQSACSSHHDFYVFSFSIIVVYILAGGGITYLWTRATASSIFTSSMMAKKNTEIADLEDQKRTLLKTAQKSVQPTSAKTNQDEAPSNEFRSETLKIYASKKIKSKDDLQRGRWGGSYQVGDYTLQAYYDPSNNSDSFYGLTISVRSSKPDWDGEVAFFMHDTFIKEIEFVKASQGVAKLETSAFEAFVVGARTSDKTELELDLNTVPGFPKDFYWTL